MNKPELVYGIGINDSNYITQPTINGRRVSCPYYKAWTSMLMRCYSDKYQAGQKTYIGCTVDPAWHSFSVFRAWMIQQDWKGKQIDKDILIEGNKVYGPLFCVFVDGKINSLLTDSAASRGGLPAGVSMRRSRYAACCSKDGVQRRLGIYDTPDQAGAVYKRFKAGVIMEAALRQSDSRVMKALFRRSLHMAM